MPIRPIDMISIAPRSQEAAQQQMSDHNRLMHANENAQQSFSKHVKDGAEVVMKPEKSEQQEYRYDAKEKGKEDLDGRLFREWFHACFRARIRYLYGRC